MTQRKLAPFPLITYITINESEKNMALTWDITAIENAKELCWQENTNPNRTEDEKYELNPVTSGLIHSGIFTGISKITKKNYKELALRLVELEIVGIAMVPYNDKTGAIGNKEPDLRNPTEEEVRLHIGLVTNVGIKDNGKWKGEIKRLIREKAMEFLYKQREVLEQDTASQYVTEDNNVAVQPI